LFLDDFYIDFSDFGGTHMAGLLGLLGARLEK
jgi:hypothetical protein